MVAPSLIYVTLALSLTVWLALTLSRNGRTFLADVFPDRPEMAKAVNELLVVGFYMLNLGWALLLIDSRQPASAAEAIVFLSTRLGMLLVTLGAIHFVNLLVFERIRRGRRPARPDPPLWPTAPLSLGGPPPHSPSGVGGNAPPLPGAAPPGVERGWH